MYIQLARPTIMSRIIIQGVPEVLGTLLVLISADL